jgi:hypothetical protein
MRRRYYNNPFFGTGSCQKNAPLKRILKKIPFPKARELIERL